MRFNPQFLAAPEGFVVDRDVQIWAGIVTTIYLSETNRLTVLPSPTHVQFQGEVGHMK